MVQNYLCYTISLMSSGHQIPELSLDDHDQFTKIAAMFLRVTVLHA